ncbi:hypothetical protein ADL03_00010 [Nocardia sp. NRRL S-836]|nr:hypothetical protein ADL03_00010 [Nocardia sp. NRRL S-836]
MTVLECDSVNLPAAFATLMAFLRTPGRSLPGRSVSIVAASAEEEPADAAMVALGAPELGIDNLEGFVTQLQKPPAWAGLDTNFTDIVHHLSVALRRGRLVAVHTDGSTEDRLLNWLDKEPRPPFRRVPPAVLKSALLRGQAKGFWLKGTHPRLTTKPDTKNTSGIQLQDTIRPHEDASFAVSAARAELPEQPDLQVLKGTVGCNPGDSSVWWRATADFRTFLAAVSELLVLLEKELAAGTHHDVLPHFANEVTDLSLLQGAFEVMVTGPDNLPPNASDELREAAGFLQDAVLTVEGSPTSARFRLHVDSPGGGWTAIKPKKTQTSTNVVLDLGVDRTCPASLTPQRHVLDALDHAGRLLTVYYRTGHTYNGGQVWETKLPETPFPRWKFQDFTGFAIDEEKPPGASAQEIHANTGGPQDNSLFGWVVEHFRDGWLICDDGPGEVADFVHIAHDGLLSLIHVKGANSAVAGRRVSVHAFEVVVSQATKNIGFLDPRLLRPRLEPPKAHRLACWSDGVRVPDRADFLESLECRDAMDKRQVVIIQPHVSELTYQRLRKSSGSPSDDLLRLRLLEDLLNSAWSSVAGSGADLIVIGSKT